MPTVAAVKLQPQVIHESHESIAEATALTHLTTGLLRQPLAVGCPVPP